MSNQTAVNFGFPRTMVAETSHWLVLVRPKQPTFGSLVLVCKEPVQAFSDVGPEAFADLQVAIKGIERLLRDKVEYEKINYLMLMMVDPHVHFHVLPRYSTVQHYEGVSFADPGWPGPPDLKSATGLSDQQRQQLVWDLQTLWNQT